MFTGINMHVEKREKYLLVSDEGIRTEFMTPVQKSTELFSAIKESGYSLVLLDYRNVHYKLPQSDAFNLIRYYEQKIPALSSYVIAAVVSNEDVNIGMLWSEVARQRGFPFKTFTDFSEAERWLLSQSSRN